MEKDNYFQMLEKVANTFQAEVEKQAARIEDMQSLITQLNDANSRLTERLEKFENRDVMTVTDVQDLIAENIPEPVETLDKDDVVLLIENNRSEPGVTAEQVTDMITEAENRITSGALSEEQVTAIVTARNEEFDVLFENCVRMDQFEEFGTDVKDQIEQVMSGITDVGKNVTDAMDDTLLEMPRNFLINQAGELVVTRNNGETETIGTVTGKDGLGVRTACVVDGELEITLSDGHIIKAGPVEKLAKNVSQAEKFTNLYKDGKTFTEIAREHNLTRQTVSKMVKEYEKEQAESNK